MKTRKNVLAEEIMVNCDVICGADDKMVKCVGWGITGIMLENMSPNISYKL